MAGKPKDITGKRYGRLVVVEATAERAGRYVVWLCRCDCGSDVLRAHLSSGENTTQSCGCYVLETLKKAVQAKRERSLLPDRIAHRDAVRRKCNSEHYRRNKGTEKQKEQSRRASKKWQEKHPEYDWAAKNRERSRFLQRKAYRRYSSELGDCYVRGLIACGSELRASDIPAPLVEAKRAHIKVQRELKERMK